MSIFTLTYAKLCERTMSTAVHPTLGLHRKALVAEGPQGWILSRAQELPRVRSEPGTSARQSQVSEEHRSSLWESRCKEEKNCCAAADRGKRRDTRDAALKALRSVGKEGRRCSRHAAAASCNPRDPQRSRLSLRTPQAPRRADLCPQTAPAGAALGWSPKHWSPRKAFTYRQDPDT